MMMEFPGQLWDSSSGTTWERLISIILSYPEVSGGIFFAHSGGMVTGEAGNGRVIVGAVKRIPFLTSHCLSICFLSVLLWMMQ